MGGNSYYEVIGVRRDAGVEEIRHAYLHAARQAHPDVAGPSGEARMRELNEAWATLRDEEKRAFYDLSIPDLPAPAAGGRAGDESRATRVRTTPLPRAGRVGADYHWPTPPHHLDFSGLHPNQRSGPPPTGQPPIGQPATGRPGGAQFGGGEQFTPPSPTPVDQTVGRGTLGRGTRFAPLVLFAIGGLIGACGAATSSPSLLVIAAVVVVVSALGALIVRLASATAAKERGVGSQNR